MQVKGFSESRMMRFIRLCAAQSRIPVRVTDESRRILFCSPEAEPLRAADLSGASCEPLFSDESGIPKLVSPGAFELMSCIPFSERGRKRFLLIGPGLLGRPETEEQLRTLRFFPEASPNEHASAISSAPVCSVGQFASFIRLLHYGLTGNEIPQQELLARSAPQAKTSQEPDSQAYLRHENEPKRIPYARELLLLSAIRAGDTEGAERFLSSSERAAFPVLPGDPQKQAVYRFVAAVNLFCRFAADGGLDEDLAFGMCDFYIQRLDACKTPLEVASLLSAAAADFAARVRKSQKSSAFSSHVVRCVDYILTHLHEAVSLRSLATETGLSEAYLSVLFKKETGTPLADFIQSKRVEEAKNLLRFSDDQIAEISTYLNFSTQSYFAGVFKRHTGMTPKQYRLTYFKKNWTG